jgi:hypothetical protein
MKKDSKYIWYFLDVIVFLVVNFLILRYLNLNKEIFPLQINWTILTIFILGIYRLTDVITQENVTDFIRAPFMDKKIDENGKETWEYSETGFRGFFGNLVSCNACMGVWVSMFIVYLYIFLPIPTIIFMLIMMFTSFERFLSKIYNFLEKKGK